jgi:uncharacterized protein YlxW (UPF0749 family)
MELSPLEIVGGIAGSAVSGTGVSAFFNWLTGRQKTKAYTMGAVDHAVQTAMSSVTGQLDRTEKRLEVVEKQHDECEANLSAVRADLDKTIRHHERERARDKAEIDRLMAAARVAVFGEEAPK